MADGHLGVGPLHPKVVADTNVWPQCVSLPLLGFHRDSKLLRLYVISLSTPIGHIAPSCLAAFVKNCLSVPVLVHKVVERLDAIPVGQELAGAEHISPAGHTILVRATGRHRGALPRWAGCSSRFPRFRKFLQPVLVSMYGNISSPSFGISESPGGLGSLGGPPGFGFCFPGVSVDDAVDLVAQSATLGLLRDVSCGGCRPAVRVGAGGLGPGNGSGGLVGCPRYYLE